MHRAQSLTRSTSLSRAWKERQGYTHGLAGTSFHNSWRGIIFSAKGRKIGYEERWKSFKNFTEDMHPSYYQGAQLSRKEKTKPFSKSNCIWINPDAASQHRMVKLEYLGETKTLIEWCLQHNLNFNGVRQRYFKGKNYPAHQILFGKLRGNSRSLLDQATLSHKDLRIKASKMISAYRCKDKKRGFTCDISIEWLIENILKKSCSYCDKAKNIGADRQDNKRGHTKDNVVPACTVCNSIKGNRFDFDQMRKIGQFIKSMITP